MDDFDDEDQRKLNSDHFFGGFQSSEEKRRPQSKKEWIEEMIKTTKLDKVRRTKIERKNFMSSFSFQYERQRENEKVFDMTENLDEQWKALSLLMGIKDRKAKSEKETPDDFDKLVHSLRFEATTPVEFSSFLFLSFSRIRRKIVSFRVCRWKRSNNERKKTLNVWRNLKKNKRNECKDRRWIRSFQNDANKLIDRSKNSTTGSSCFLLQRSILQTSRCVKLIWWQVYEIRASNFSRVFIWKIHRETQSNAWMPKFIEFRHENLDEICF